MVGSKVVVSSVLLELTSYVLQLAIFDKKKPSMNFNFVHMYIFAYCYFGGLGEVKVVPQDPKI